MIKTILDISGTMLLVLAVGGLVSPGAGGAHFSHVHNSINLVSGGFALWYGLKGTVDGARAFSWIMAGFYGALAIAGFAVGGRGNPAFAPSLSDSELWAIAPGVLEFGRADHVLHLMIAIAFIAGALMAKPVDQTVPAKTAA
jgi:hypothetical protein